MKVVQSTSTILEADGGALRHIHCRQLTLESADKIINVSIPRSFNKEGAAPPYKKSEAAACQQ